MHRHADPTPRESLPVSPARRGELAIVRARPGDAPALSRIAFAAKRHWGYPESWIQHWSSALTVTPELIAGCQIHFAEVAGRAVGYYALRASPEAAFLEHLFVMPEWMGRGVGRKLFYHALKMAAKTGASALDIESDPNAEPFYLKMGAARYGERSYELDGQRRVLPLLSVRIPAFLQATPRPGSAARAR